MKLNEKNVASFATCSSPIDREGYLAKRGDFNKGYQRRWFVLKGNLLFYFERKQDKEPLGLIVLEACSVQASSQAKYAFEISFDGQGTRLYVMVADNNEDMELWMKAISHASYEYMRSIVDELQRRVDRLTSSSKADQEAAASEMSLLHVGPAKSVVPRPKSVQGETLGKSSTATVRVENGILVDLSEAQPAPPPIPKKTKSSTLANNPQHAQVSMHSPPPEGQGSDTSPAAQSLQQRLSVHQVASASPYSSPYALPSRLNPAKPLSPPSTLDRTPVMQPLSSTLPVLPTTETPYMRPPRPADWANKSTTSGEATLPQSSPSAQRPKQVAAPMDSKKNIYEMHEDFTRALNALHQERDAGSSKHS